MAEEHENEASCSWYKSMYDTEQYVKTYRFSPMFTQNRYTIARPWAWAMGCLLWVPSVTYVLSLARQCCFQCRVIRPCHNEMGPYQLYSRYHKFGLLFVIFVIRNTIIIQNHYFFIGYVTIIRAQVGWGGQWKHYYCCYWYTCVDFVPKIMEK